MLWMTSKVIEEKHFRLSMWIFEGFFDLEKAIVENEKQNKSIQVYSIQLCVAVNVSKGM